jgi:hypothetical protein
MTWLRTASNPVPVRCPAMHRAEVAELEDALDSKSSGALPRAGSIPAFGMEVRGVIGLRGAFDMTDA